jgi:N utilization substance protein A
MENVNLIDTFSEFNELKNIDRPTMMSVLEDVFRGMLTKKFGSADNFDIIVNIDKGDFEIWRNRVVVDDKEVTDPVIQIPLSEAKKIDEDYEVGEEVSDEVKQVVVSDISGSIFTGKIKNVTTLGFELETEVKIK